MIEDTNQHKNALEKHIAERDKHIEKKVNSLSVYNVYWCLAELHSRGKLRTEDVRKNDSLCKIQLVNTLKRSNYAYKDIDAIFEISAVNNIPFSYVKWFYEDNRAALWLSMILKGCGILSNAILSESDLSILIHDIIFNRNLFIRGEKLIEDDSSDSEWIVSSKKISLAYLKQAYIRTKVNEKGLKWLTSRNSDRISKINYEYQYMQKVYDLDNLIGNKKRKKDEESNENTSQDSNKDASKNINKSGYRQALIYTDSISFPETETTARLCHILASLDYWTFNRMMNEAKAANRTLFIKNMYDAWNAQQKRDRDKHKKNQGLDLTSANKKNLKYLAKTLGKKQRDVLNELVESAYNQISHKGIQRNSAFPNQVDFFDSIPQTQPSSSQSEKNTISEETLHVEDKGKLSNTYGDLLDYSTLYIDKYALNDTVETSQNSGLVKPFYPQESSDKQTENEQSSADFNAQFIADKEAGRFR